MDQQIFDVTIVGGGPAGSACAISLANTGLKVALIDKHSFPRDKICGDALSIDVVNQMSLLSEELAKSFSALKNKMPSYGIKLFSPDHSSLAIPLKQQEGKTRCAYVSPRIDFDNVLFQHAKSCDNIQCFENSLVEKITCGNNEVEIQSSDFIIRSKIIIGADGAHSIVSKNLANIEVDKDHYSAALRIYYEGITGFDEGNPIELHFFREVMPGYLWLFPLAENKANVGIGMLSSEVAKHKVNLKEVLQNLIMTHPRLKERFSGARALETVKGFGLPLGSVKRNISGERFLLTGDAAGLIDPFSGEGIGNAIRSGRIAGKHIQKCFSENNFSANFNKSYDKEIYNKMWKEFKVSRILQRLAKYPWLCNVVIRKANSNKYIQSLLHEALDNVDKRKSLFTKPRFYLGLMGLGKRKTF
ncbi:MAG: NAD(P)/FAD-dependent oxidoreductase [Chitinophagaceae bacterium]